MSTKKTQRESVTPADLREIANVEVETWRTRKAEAKAATDRYNALRGEVSARSGIRPDSLRDRLDLAVAKTQELEARDAETHAAEAAARALDAAEFAEGDELAASTDAKRAHDQLAQAIVDRDAAVAAAELAKARVHAALSGRWAAFASLVARRRANSEPLPIALPRAQQKAPSIGDAPPEAQLAALRAAIVNGPPALPANEKLLAARSAERSLRAELGREVEAENDRKRQAAAFDRQKAREVAAAAAAASKDHAQMLERAAEEQAEEERLAALQRSAEAM